MLDARTSYAAEAVRHERALYTKLIRQGLPKEDDRVDFERRSIDRLLRHLAEQGDYQELRRFVGPTISLSHIFTSYPSTKDLRARIYPGLAPDVVTNVARTLDEPLLMQEDSAAPVEEARRFVRLLLGLNTKQSPFLAEQSEKKSPDS
jgi:hypothetical protein